MRLFNFRKKLKEVTLPLFSMDFVLYDNYMPRFGFHAMDNRFLSHLDSTVEALRQNDISESAKGL